MSDTFQTTTKSISSNYKKLGSIDNWVTLAFK